MACCTPSMFGSDFGTGTFLAPRYKSDEEVFVARQHVMAFSCRYLQRSCGVDV
jgi:hypothetical protein